MADHFSFLSSGLIRYGFSAGDGVDGCQGDDAGWWPDGGDNVARGRSGALADVGVFGEGRCGCHGGCWSIAGDGAGGLDGDDGLGGG